MTEVRCIAVTVRRASDNDSRCWSASAGLSITPHTRAVAECGGVWGRVRDPGDVHPEDRRASMQRGTWVEEKRS